MKLSFVDIETTGSSTTHDRIIEIGILRVEEGSIVRTYETLIHPETYLNPFITQITGITQDDLETAPAFEDVKDEILEILDGTIFVAHNVRFDYGFLKQEMKRYGHILSQKHLCTVKLSRYLYPQYHRHNLDEIIARFGFSMDRRHRAYDDARVLWDFYSHIKKEFETKQIDQAVAELIKDPKIPTYIDPHAVSLIPECPGVYVFYGEQNEVLYVGKSINLAERIQSHFSLDHASDKEMHISRQMRRIETIPTASDFGAQLLEARLIKELKPTYNTQLRDSQILTILKKTQTKEGIDTIVLEDVEIIHARDLPEILGIFRTQEKAKDYIKKQCDEYALCPRILGLEKGSGACFSSKIEKCKGICTGQEKPIAYNIRFLQAFSKRKIRPWIFPGGIQIKEHDREGERTDLFYVDNWCIVTPEMLEIGYDSKNLVFDYDRYKILLGYLLDAKNKKKIKKL